MLCRILKTKSIQKILKRNVHLIETKVGVVGVPFEKGQQKNGVSMGTQALRDGGIVEKLSSLHEKMDVKDYGDIIYSIRAEAKSHEVPNMANYPHIPACNHELSKTVEQIIKEGRICLTLGGDHSIAVGSVDGHIKAKDNICILYVDAHADLNTNSTSESGNVHGMSVALLVKELTDYWPLLPGMDWLKPTLSLRNVAYIGLRSVDPYEKLIFQQFDIAAFGMEHVDKFGINNVISFALNRIDPERNKSIHVSFDIDALDPTEAPSTTIPVRGGLKLREALQIMETIHDTGRLGAVDIVELNPANGSERDLKQTVDAAVNVLLAAFGNKRSGLIPRELSLKKKRT